MNVEHLKAITGMPYDVETRIFSIATNAVQQTRIAKNRGATPFSDNDLKVLLAIKSALNRIETETQVDASVEHAPLVSQDTKHDPVLDKIHSIMEAELVQEVVDRQQAIKKTATK
jgi:hypothetical protein